MGRSNNQLRRTAKQKGIKVYIPKMVKSKTKNQARKVKAMLLKNKSKVNKKLSYDKVKTKDGKVKKRIFRSGGYNNSGKFGRKSK
ncbi:hypothetical protein AGDE_04278 [Angomonas deanei]|uniref:Uncharacterized protein n=1 Tax=Angomonas deanei TaxID=59799 RepID=A0A7G2CS40_9TRYP|nr:hypothetical protein AGDE_04278 [Angomonas deanei]CAD2221283.1 hypothetical protein, conserved [Angomonas deanei]|eukprot:EPY39650.1 hypothetical protein AGDE_04278 [Angomonas deanei]